MNYLAIALVILIIIILYSFFTYMTNNALVSGLQPLSTPMSWTFNKLLNPTALSYSYQCWLFMTDKPTAATTPIFFRGKSEIDKEFQVSLDQSLNLTIEAKLSTDAAGATSKIMTVMTGFPLQKWVYLAVNVNQRNVEAYVNGRLVKTVNVPKLSNPSMRAGLTIGHANLKGHLSKFYRLPETLDAQKVQNNYLKGNGLNNWVSSVFPYGMSFTITSGESASRVIKLL